MRYHNPNPPIRPFPPPSQFQTFYPRRLCLLSTKRNPLSHHSPSFLPPIYPAPTSPSLCLPSITPNPSPVLNLLNSPVLNLSLCIPFLSRSTSSFKSPFSSSILTLLRRSGVPSNRLRSSFDFRSLASKKLPVRPLARLLELALGLRPSTKAAAAWASAVRLSARLRGSWGGFGELAPCSCRPFVVCSLVSSDGWREASRMVFSALRMLPWASGLTSSGLWFLPSSLLTVGMRIAPSQPSPNVMTLACLPWRMNRPSPRSRPGVPSGTSSVSPCVTSDLTVDADSLPLRWR
ncbi:hypothetical protein BDZ85DRAFT_33044 [Elsinoe ampelina]|uniref:Uncharacterized protein n=1 Tax=Elsinoe ampelina TaxID=302913 RepID=A0A6A6G396_9PEZI|nr:hypothetical protein BDZ85DRAFT_33044 [Elsinoe ampelina]